MAVPMIMDAVQNYPTSRAIGIEQWITQLIKDGVDRNDIQIEECPGDVTYLLVRGERRYGWTSIMHRPKS